MWKEKRRQRKDERRRNRQKRRERRAQERESVFLDSLDRYEDEYDAIRRVKPVKGLLGVFEFNDKEFYALSLEDKLGQAGFPGHSIVYYTADIDHGPLDKSATGVGHTCAVRSPAGKMRSIIFVRKDIAVKSEVDDPHLKREVEFGVRILLLLHEMGHADDIRKGVNYDHENLTLDVVAAEVYAHGFALAEAKRRDYRLALGQYVRELQTQRESEDEYTRRIMKRVFSTLDVDAYERFACGVWTNNPDGQDTALARRRITENPAKYRRKED
jgi:hypothetical protein